MITTLELTIPPELRDKIQRANIERDAYRDILSYILTSEDINISEERINKYYEEYYEKYKNFEDIKSELEKVYIQPLSQNGFLNWLLDYDTCIVKVDVNED